MKFVVASILIALTGCTRENPDIRMDLGADRNGRYWLLYHTIRESGDKNIASVLTEVSEDSELNKEFRRTGRPLLKGTTALWVYDCDNRTIQTTRRVAHFGDESQVELPDKEADLIPGESIAEKGMEFACTSAWKRWLFLRTE